MSLHPDRIQETHLSRKACVYVRQSSVAQVLDHHESTRRQYGLRERARQLGWAEERIEVIDEDLGHSASDVAKPRLGFQGLLGQVVTSEVGAIFSVEISRLARQDSEGHRLVEVAALTDTLLIDEQQVYDPRVSDDRLMLGLKVLLSSNEIRLMNQRLRDNKLRKAQRGELRFNVPVGLVCQLPEGIQLDPDEQVRAAVKLLFERFRLSGRLSTVVHYFHDNGLLFPRRKGSWDGPVEWAELSLERARELLMNPLYAGAYVYGRTKRRLRVLADHTLEHPRHLLPADEWAVAQWDAFEGYISRAEYEANQVRLQQNRANPHLPSRSRRRDGPALLGGLLLCGRCGQPMHVGYQGTNGTRSVYLCNTCQIHYAEKVCQRVPGKAVDRWVVERLLTTLTPAQIELSLAAVDELERQQAAVGQQWQHRLEAAHYAARLAQRRYEQADPENRLVARTLEHQWETNLREAERLEAEFETVRRAKPLSLSPEQRQALLTLASDLPQIWSAPTTSWTERKDLLELLVADVTLTRHATGITVQLRWFTNQVETGELPLPISGKLPVSAVVLERLRTLGPTHSDHELAELLNQEGLKSPSGKAFSRSTVQAIRHLNGIHKNRSAASKSSIC